MTGRLLVLERGLGGEALAVQARHPGWRLGLDVETLSWCAMRQLSPTCQRWIYGPSLASLAVKLASEVTSSE